MKRLLAVDKPPTCAGESTMPEYVCVDPKPEDEVCECGGYEEWEYEVCEACFLPAPTDFR